MALFSASMKIRNRSSTGTRIAAISSTRLPSWPRSNSSRLCYTDMSESHLQLLAVQQHILEEQRRLCPVASGEFSWLLSGITLATKIVEAQVRRAGLAGIIGVTRETNIQGEQVQ